MFRQLLQQQSLLKLMAAIGNTQLSLSPVRILGDNYPKCKWQRKVVCFLPAIQRGKGREGGEGALSPISKYEFPHTRFCGSHHYRTLPPPPPLPPQYRQTLYSTGILYSDRGVAVRPVCVCVYLSNPREAFRQYHHHFLQVLVCRTSSSATTLIIAKMNNDVSPECGASCIQCQYHQHALTTRARVAYLSGGEGDLMASSLHTAEPH